MNALLSYSIGITMPLMLMWGVYKLTLARTTLHRFNRATLLAIYLFALLIIPAIQAIPSAIPSNYVVNLNVIEITEQNGTLTEEASILSLSSILPYIYIFGVILMAMTMLISILRIALLIKNSDRIKYNGFTIAIHKRNDLVPFSWGKWVIISLADYKDGGEYIIAHELSHLRSHHWLDLLIAQIAIIINWYNPATWLMRYELQDVHEYSADEFVIKSTIISSEQYQLFLIKKTAGTRFAAIANSLNHSSLKKRITMMLSKKSRGAARMRALALVPAAALALIFVNKPVEATASTPSSTETIVSSDKDTKKINTAGEVDKMAEFPGGKAALYKFINDNIKYPEDSKDKGGNVIIRFTISETGKVTNPEIVRGQTESLNNEAMRIINMLPDFTPAKSNGKNVPMVYTIPFQFSAK